MATKTSTVCFATTKKWPLPLWRTVISTSGGVCWALNEINLSILSHKKSLQPSLLTQVHTPFPQCHPFFFTSLLPLPSSSNKPKKDKDTKTSRSQTHTHTAPHSDTNIFRFAFQLANGLFKIRQRNSSEIRAFLSLLHAINVRVNLRSLIGGKVNSILWKYSVQSFTSLL